MGGVDGNILIGRNGGINIRALEENATASILYSPFLQQLHFHIGGCVDTSHALETDQNARDRKRGNLRRFTLLHRNDFQHELCCRCLDNRQMLVNLLRMVHVHISASTLHFPLPMQLIGEHAKQRLLVDRLWCEAGTDNIVAACHALHNLSLQIGVRYVCSHVDGISRIHHNYVKEVGCKHTTISRILDVKITRESYRVHQTKNPLLDERDVLLSLEMLLERINRLDGMLRIGLNIRREQRVQRVLRGFSRLHNRLELLAFLFPNQLTKIYAVVKMLSNDFSAAEATHGDEGSQGVGHFRLVVVILVHVWLGAMEDLR